MHFVGRLATYRYYNMDQVVAQSLTLCNKLVQRERRPVANANVGAHTGGSVATSLA